MFFDCSQLNDFKFPVSRLELKHCEVGCFVKDRVISCVGRLGENLRVLEIPRLGSDDLLGVLARRCPNLEVLNLKGSREQVTDLGLVAYVDILKDKTKLLQVRNISGYLGIRPLAEA